jgi:oxidase EvaA|tara:strand:+ start:327 stop:1028 length:702 start_codon:yes stop_codon:yes gene_type:complete
MNKIHFKNLESFRKKIEVSSYIESKKINYVLKWLKNKNSTNKMVVKKVNIKKLKDWNNDGKGNLFHKSNQFFGVEGIKVLTAKGREVSSWDQPIMTQKHGGILAILTRIRENGIVEFLLCARKEPGDVKIKLCPSFSATQSNINLAHGGKKTPLTDLVINKKKSNLVGKTIHFEEGARFWRKPNQNLLIKVDKKEQSKIKNSNFIWLNLSQIKKLNLVDGIINPFVKTILFMI